MTEQEHREIAKTLRAKITKASNAAKMAGSLSDKLIAQKATKALECELHEHLLNFFELTK